MIIIFEVTAILPVGPWSKEEGTKKEKKNYLKKHKSHLALEGFRKKKNDAKKGLIPDKKKSYSRHPKISWWNSAIFLHVFLRETRFARCQKKKKKNM